MPDKSQTLILDALSRAAADPAGLPLLSGRSTSGLFRTSQTAKKVAQHCLEQGLLRVIHPAGNGRGPTEICGITEKGLAFLFSQVRPQKVLEDVLRALESRKAQMHELVAVANRIQLSLEGLKTIVSQAVANAAKVTGGASGTDTSDAVLRLLAEWQETKPAADFPLPELYRRRCLERPELTLGQFHDELRRLHDAGRIYLHPWTGPLYDLPEPACALLAGHEIVYYASLKI